MFLEIIKFKGYENEKFLKKTTWWKLTREQTIPDGENDKRDKL